MNTQQRPFFQAVTSGIHKGRFHLSRWIAVTTALLFVSCASLTPDRIAVLAAIAGQAAQVGAQAWLKDHPDQKPIFDALITAIGALVQGGVTNQNAYVELLKTLPVAALAGPDGAVTWQTNGVFIVDAALEKTVPVKEPATIAVMRSFRSGLKRACAPMPPMPMPGQTKTRLRSYVIPATNLPAAPYPGEAVITPESPDAPVKTDAELDAEFEAIKKKLKKTPSAPPVQRTPPRPQF